MVLPQDHHVKTDWRETMSNTSRTIAAVVLVALLAPLVAACGGGGPSAQPTAAKPAGQATAKPAAQATAAPAQPARGGDPSDRVSQAYTLLMGESDKPGVLASFHLELAETAPQYNRESKAVETTKTNLKADVQGTGVHLWIAEDDGTTTEGYVIGSDDYVVQDGKVEQNVMAGVGLTWAMSQLSPVIILSLAGLGAKPAGTEAIDGRKADAFDLDMAAADKLTLDTVRAFIGRGVTVAKGKAWVDQETGALLKTALDYEVDLYDSTSSDKNAPPLGHGAGHIEIAVSKVGKVTVSLPK